MKRIDSSSLAATALLALLAAALPTDAVAHIVKGESIGFFSGFEHPISGLDHVIAMVAVGLIALSGVCLGAAVLLELRPPLWMAGILVGVFGLFHGYAHGSELPPGQNALLYSLGFVLATGLLHATGIAIGLIHRWQWGQLALRGAGAFVLCGGMFFLWGALS